MDKNGNTAASRKIVGEKTALLEEKQRREYAENVYWHQCAKCSARGLPPPRPPEWLDIHWEPEKRGMSTKEKIVVLGIAAIVFVLIIGIFEMRRTM